MASTVNVTLRFNSTPKSVNFDSAPPFVLTKERPTTGSATVKWNLVGTPGAQITNMAMKAPWPYKDKIAFTPTSATLSYTPTSASLEVYSYVVELTHNGVTYTFDPEIGNDPPSP
jgi:hypothetical protein